MGQIQPGFLLFTLSKRLAKEGIGQFNTLTPSQNSSVIWHRQISFGQDTGFPRPEKSPRATKLKRGMKGSNYEEIYSKLNLFTFDRK